MRQLFLRRHLALAWVGLGACAGCRSTAASAPTDAVAIPAPSSPSASPAEIDAGAPPADVPIPHAVPAAEHDAGGVPADIFACGADKDCVAVPTGGCCFIGHLIAVNAAKGDAYKKATPCEKERPLCPMIRVRETRVPRCVVANHRCEMVAP